MGAPLISLALQPSLEHGGALDAETDEAERGATAQESPLVADEDIGVEPDPQADREGRAGNAHTARLPSMA
jgi:hypothetical protein